MVEIKTQIYDITLGELRDITEADVNRWKDLEAFVGQRFVFQRALLEAERQIWIGAIEWNALSPILQLMLKILDLDMNARPIGGEYKSGHHDHDQGQRTSR